MARLDVSEILSDPDFMDTGLILERITQTVGDDGMAVNATKKTKFSAVVLSGNSDLRRIPAGERVDGKILVYTRQHLQEGQAGLTADIIQWRGRRYTVEQTNDYQNFGRGFTEAVCQIIPFSGG